MSEPATWMAGTEPTLRSRPPARAPVGARRVFSSNTLLATLAHGAGVTVILMLVALVAVLTWAALPAIHTFGPKFFIDSDWRPNELEQPKRDARGDVVLQDGEIVMEAVPPSFGALPVIYGTAASSLLALAIAVPLSFGTAIFLVRIAHKRLVAPISFLIEFLAAIPSIAFGIWGLFVLAPALQGTAHFRGIEPMLASILVRVPGLGWMFTESITAGSRIIERQVPLTGRDLFCGGLVLGIMILPIITALSRDVLRQVPRAQIEGTLALGATWWQSAWEMLRYSRSALFGAVMLGLARAAGETMAVTMVIGNNSRISASIFAPAQTMSSLLANEFAEASSQLHRAALTEVALILLLMSLAFNVVARSLVVGRGARTAAAH